MLSGVCLPDLGEGYSSGIDSGLLPDGLPDGSPEVEETNHLNTNKIVISLDIASVMSYMEETNCPGKVIQILEQGNLVGLRNYGKVDWSAGCNSK